jgi:hypothetical protein
MAYVVMNRAELGTMLGNIGDAKFYHRGEHSGATISKKAPWSELADYVYERPLAVEAEVRQVLLVDVRISQRNNTAYCGRNFAFTPKSGHTYRFTPRGYGENRCDITVIDTQTNSPPEDLALLEETQ